MPEIDSTSIERELQKCQNVFKIQKLNQAYFKAGKLLKFKKFNIKGASSQGICYYYVFRSKKDFLKWDHWIFSKSLLRVNKIPSQFTVSFKKGSSAFEKLC